jgi:hypothetical protein
MDRPSKAHPILPQGQSIASVRKASIRKLRQIIEAQSGVGDGGIVLE